MPASAAWAVDSLLFSTGQPQAADIGEGLHYYGVQSILGIDWYPHNDGDPGAAGDWFAVSRPGRITGVTFWGILKDYGGGPGEMHVYVYAFDPNRNVLVERFHAWNSNTPNWDAFHVATEDPSGLGTASVERWHVELADLPNFTGDAHVGPTERYVLVVAGDDWADEFAWSHNAPGGLVGGAFDNLYWSPTKDVGTTGLCWAPFDLGHGPQANNLAFEITGLQSAAGDFDFDGDVDLGDFAHFLACVNGPNRPAAQAGCIDADLDADHDVDIADFLRFQACFNGPDRPAACP